MHSARRRLHWRVNWKITCFTLFFLPLLVSLGFWQLERARDKETILENWAEQQTLPTMPLHALKKNPPKDGTKVSLSGEFDTKHYWLQEGKVVDGRVGYGVLAKLITSTQKHILINRGWVPADPDRRVLPDLDFPISEQVLSGVIRVPSRVPLINEAHNSLSSWPHRILSIDIKQMRSQCQCDLEPFIVTLNQENPNAFTVVPRTLNIDPQRHRGYALQWFMMAATLVILWLVTNTSLFQIIKKYIKQADSNT